VDLLISGLITGAVFAIAASGLVVTYSTSGIFNFAHGALGMFCAYVYWDVRVDHHVPAPIALGVVLLVVAPALGAFLYRVVISGLQGTPEIVKLVVPISVLLGLISLANWIWKPIEPHTIQPFFGVERSITVFGTVVIWHEVTILLVAAALAVGLRVLLYRTRTGVAMRAVVDDRPLLELNGGRPERASLISWMLGVSLSALAGILITPFQGGALSSTLLTLLVINAFAAAMFGRLRNLPLTFVGAVVLGFATRMAFERPTGLMPKSFDWRGNLRLAVPMLLLFVVLLALPQDRLRGAVVTRTRERFNLPTMREALIAAACFVGAIFLLSRILAPTDLLTLSDAMGASIILLSLVLLVGYAGEISLATMALAGIGGTVLYHHVGHDLGSRAGPLAYVLAMGVTALIGAVIALPALRLRGLYLALATAAFSLGVEQLLFKEFTAERRIYPVTLIALAVVGAAATWLRWRSRGVRAAAVSAAVALVAFALAATNPWLQDERWSPLFPNGSLSLPRPRFLGIDFAPQANFLMLLTVVFAVLGVALIALRRSGYGRRLAALKDSPAACATLGMDVVRLKLSVFMLSAALAGLGGCLFAQEVGAVTSDRFSLFESMSMLMLLVVAGMGYVSGGFAAGLLHGAVFVVMQGLFRKLGVDHPAFDDQLQWLGQFTSVLPALIGVSLGQNPSGFLHDSYRDWGLVIRRRTPIFLAGVALELAAWFLTFQDVISGWAFALFTMAWVLVLPRLAPRPPREASTPVELIGIDRPFTPADKVAIDRHLELHEGTPA
jgi:branched-subunit amino acid ABC-type transport system permease component